MTDIARDELARRLDTSDLVVLDVRTAAEFSGRAGYPCDARQGHIPGARHVDVQELLDASDPAVIPSLVGVPAGAEVVVYCHSGSRSAMAASVLIAAGYDARNYVGSWHEWAADEELPCEIP